MLEVMLEMLTAPVDKGLKLLAAGSVLLVIYGLAGLLSNLVWYVGKRRELRRRHKS